MDDTKDRINSVQKYTIYRIDGTGLWKPKGGDEGPIGGGNQWGWPDEWPIFWPSGGGN